MSELRTHPETITDEARFLAPEPSRNAGHDRHGREAPGVSRLSGERLAMLMWRSDAAVTVLAQLARVPQQGVTLLDLRFGPAGAWLVLLRLEADLRYRVSMRRRACPGASAFISAHVTLTDALLAVDRLERDFAACAGEIRPDTGAELHRDAAVNGTRDMARPQCPPRR